MKGALPPTIALAMYRSPAVATVYGNFGFLIALASILSLHFQPRARFLLNVGFAALLTCLAAATSLLSHYAGLKARKHTTSSEPGAIEEAYNSSASAINALFLTTTLYLISSLRAAYPSLTIPFLISTIFSIVAISNGPELRSQHASLVLCRQLLYCYLTGFGIAAAVGVLFFPKTSRTGFVEGVGRFVGECRGVVAEERDLLRSLDNSVVWADVDDGQRSKQATALKVSVMGMLNSMSRSREELSWARQEIAVGVFGYDDLESLLHHLEGLMVPILGLSKVAGFSIMSEQTREHSDPFSKLIDASMLSFEIILGQLDSAFQLTGLLLQANGIFSKPDWSTIPSEFDEEKNELEQKLKTTIELARSDLATILVGEKDLGKSTKEGFTSPELVRKAEEHLYILCLLRSTSAAANELSELTRAQLVQSAAQGPRLILPPFFTEAFLPRRTKHQQNAPLDPEHLPPRNAVERFGNTLRSTFSTLGSDSSKFGLRVVAATMSLGIMAFLKSTQRFFVEYRVVWAVVMIPISMSPTAGTAIYGFVGRALGVAAAMLLAYVNWYIVDGKVAGVVVMFFLCMMLYYFLLLRYPRFIVLFILAAANHVLIIGYELQLSVRVPTPIVSPQRYFPIYTLAPYRLLCVLAALFVAFIFTVFPVQISEHKILRKNVGASLALLTSYSSSVSASLDQRIRGLEGDTTQANSPGRILKARRNEILFRKLALLSGMRQISAMVPWEISLGGKFPKDRYDRLVDAIQRYENISSPLEAKQDINF
ncbi:hypothetical protein K402DRAFT_339639 [Aulographum hederae CBS 113979]|uniref:Uncharacterized protein n=1 Tax=Aulographum hederae CBS 113979 TaxID=1176131 RepID=A0A6G1GPA3_9PEZI|nr:hypothetical protein K402DRAFT_339639 [Aulographum hederae CBS 113979]